VLGALRWREDSDKMGREWFAHINVTVRASLDRVLKERPRIGPAYLFPSPLERTKLIRCDLAAAWLREAEQLAGLVKMNGSLWHAFRRGWVTARKHLPDVDVAAAGG
jgi:hypothetical protein